LGLQINEKLDGTAVAQRYAPKDFFVGYQMSTAWDALHRAHFDGEALRTYLYHALPSGDGRRTFEEVEPWREAETAQAGLKEIFGTMKKE